MPNANQTKTFDHPLSGDSAVVADRAPLPEAIGPYRLIECIGEGGMGTVYKANQIHPVKRTVAIKLIKLGFDSTEVIARFESERQALARMDHPNIAKVLDAGTDDRGRPYFVMEYVPGKPIAKYADDNRLSIQQRLELILQVCDAIGHAHAKAIIHRDIKSGNVLAHTTADGPRIKVIDFGVAKALTSDRLTDRTFNTARGQAIGTYESMSPEQADGSPDIDTRTDVYALGVLLYELLSGSKPFDKSNLAKAGDAEIRRIIREDHPPRPSTQLSSMGNHATNIAHARQIDVKELARQLKTELDWIPLMALRKERERRYATPQQMAQDIRNYLEGRPLIAAPDSKIYRLSKFARRNRGPIIASATVVLTLILATVVTSIAAAAAMKARERAEAQKKEAVEQRQKADAATATAERERSEQVAAAQAAEDATNAFTAIIVPAGKDQNMTILQAVTEAEKHLDDKPRSQDMRDRLRVSLGTALNELGRYDQAIEVLKRVSGFRSAPGPDADLVTAQYCEQLAIAMEQTDRFRNNDDMLVLANDALKIRMRLQPPDSGDIATLKANMAGLTLLQLSVPKAEQSFLISMQQYFDNRPLPELRRWMLLQVERAKDFMVQGQIDQAVDLYREEIKPLLDRAESRPHVPESLRLLAVFVHRRGDVLGGEALMRISAKMSEEINKDDQPLVAHALSALGDYLVTYERDTKGLEGTEFQRRGLDIARRKIGPTNPTTIDNAATLATALRSLGKTAEADQVRNDLLTDTPSDQIEGARFQARVLTLLALDIAGSPSASPAELDQAERDARQAVEFAEKAFAIEDSANELFTISMNLETVLRARGNFVEAKKVSDKWIEIVSKKYGLADRHVGLVQDRIGLDLQGMGQLPAAIDTFKKAFATMDNSGALTQSVIECILNLAHAQDATGDYTDAEGSYRLYLNRCKIRYGDDNPDTIEATKVLAQNLAKRPITRSEAASLFAQALKQSSVLLGDEADLTLEIRRCAQDCGIALTDKPATQPALRAQR